MLFGGLLPPGAGVDRRGGRGDGRTDGRRGQQRRLCGDSEDGQPGEPALGYRDAAGAFVHRPMPAGCQHHPVADAEEPCPVPGAVQYDEYFPTEDWRAGHGTKGTETYVPSPLVLCRVCGHEEQAGGIIHFRRAEAAGEQCGCAGSADGPDSRRARAPALVREQIKLMGVTFPIYAAEGWLARINGERLAR